MHSVDVSNVETEIKLTDKRPVNGASVGSGLLQTEISVFYRHKPSLVVNEGHLTSPLATRVSVSGVTHLFGPASSSAHSLHPKNRLAEGNHITFLPDLAPLALVFVGYYSSACGSGRILRRSSKLYHNGLMN